MEKKRDGKQMEELTDFACGIWENSKKEGETHERRTTAGKRMRKEIRIIKWGRARKLENTEEPDREKAILRGNQI